MLTQGERVCTCTLPTEEMREAMKDAVVGDDMCMVRIRQ